MDGWVSGGSGGEKAVVMRGWVGGEGTGEGRGVPCEISLSQKRLGLRLGYLCFLSRDLGAIFERFEIESETWVRCLSDF